MPGTIDLPDLVTRVRRRSDMENTQFVTDSEVEDYIQGSYGEVYDLIIESAGIDHFRQDLTFDTVAGQYDYPLNSTLGGGGEGDVEPLPIYKTVGVDVMLGDRYRPIRPGRRLDVAGRLESRTWTLTEAITYSVHQEETWRVLRLYPTPAGIYSVRLQYIPSPEELRGTGSFGLDVLFNGFAGWDELIVVDAAAKVLEKDDRDARHLYKRKAELEARIRWHAQTMNQDGPGRVRNVDATSGWGTW